MAALLGRKLGMTQVFGEDGRVERVTVVEAGPCHVTAIRTPDRDGYEAVQLAFGEVKERRITKAELGHLKKADAPALRHVREFRDEAGELQVGDKVTVETFEKGQKVKVSGTSKGKGFQGTVKRHNFSRGPVTLDDSVFGEEFHMPLVHETVRAELNARRQGSSSTKTRGEVNMTGAKAFRQKGTGRARAGALSTPQRVGGGVAFGPKPRGYTVKVNRKARRRALRAALSEHARRGSLAIADPSDFDAPSTKKAAQSCE